MADETTRRGAIVAAGAATLGVLTLSTSTVEASKFPRLDSAIKEMKDARAFLQKAPDVFGGHKAAAIRLLKEAIQELEAAVEFAK